VEADESVLIAALRAGDQGAFQRVVRRYRRELLAHCYRMLGSFEDAEDMLQETLLRAWRGLEGFEGRSTIRAWLYKIATNACLDALASRRRRALPNGTHVAAVPGEPFPPPLEHSLWVEPIPDALIDLRLSANPDARYEARESVALTFLAALQVLPGRQRAVLILRDVLGWRAREVAEHLGVSVAAVTSALERGRASMREHRARASFSNVDAADRGRIAVLLSRYVDAWHAGDAEALLALVHEDVVFTMPPLPLWYQGKAAVRSFLETELFRGDARGRFRLLPATANGCPAFATYQLDENGVYRFGALQVLTIEEGSVVEIHDFLALSERLLTAFALQLAL
jgi:RNA polymerase sigma-70 factor (ECF subfamily)